jgi:hypothetical protein
MMLPKKPLNQVHRQTYKYTFMGEKLMSKSEIFDSFVKIAQEKGMISEDAPEKAKKKLEKDHRADSLDISAIEALYGTKPDRPKDMDYKRNIIEDAHPNSVVISPSYDKLNGLVENDQERQNIILNILSKPPHGHLTQPKYAEKELILSLVRLGNTLDLQKKDNLRELSDVCLGQVTQQPLKKQAIWIAVAVGVAAAIGALYVQQHMSFVNEGFQKNHEKLIGEIDDLLGANSDWGVGYQYSADFKSMVQDFRSKLMSFYTLYQKVLPIIQDLEKPRTAKDLVALSQKPETDTVIKAYRTFRAAADNMLPYITTIEKDFSSESYKTRQIEDKGWMTSLVDKMQVFHGGKGLVADDFDDVVRAIAPYKKSIGEMMEVLKKAESLEKSAKDQIQQAAFTSQKEFGSDMGSPSASPTDTGSKPPSMLVSNPGKKDEFDNGIEDLEKDLAGGFM